jgi:hypothetical protein
LLKLVKVTAKVEKIKFGFQGIREIVIIILALINTIIIFSPSKCGKFETNDIKR